MFFKSSRDDFLNKLSKYLNKQYRSIFKTQFRRRQNEIKNPLICISELVDQLKDKETYKAKTKRNKDTGMNFHSTNISPTSDKITQIKALSNYLLVLVKDLNYFAQTQINKIPCSFYFVLFLLIYTFWLYFLNYYFFGYFHLY